MSNFKDSPNFEVHNDYYTPKYAWEWINHLIPENKIIWESCMLNSLKSKSPQYLTELGHNVIYDTSIDMLLNTPDNYDMIITNPPFETDLKKKILKRLVELDKPFILVLNACNMFTKYIREIFGDKLQYLQVINPSKKIQYDKYENHEFIKTKNCSFYSVFLCYKLDLSPEKLWLD
tara:strand:+ start:686 stop:1213 length:528 start_codon:yes stop_codon:yes gene_type:complete